LISNVSVGVVPVLIHIHPEIVLAFCFQSGTGEMEVDGVIYVVEAGTTVTVHPKEEHEIR
jgi:mannose-6-phosphate isomerase-like protein (cupin superfamily)